jgi:23S rRNA (uracil1939-C5)-methyltransferase
MVAGGHGLAREASGRIVLAAGALPGELVDVRFDVDKRDVARGPAVAVVEASPGRVEPPCPHVADGCGGCDLQHAVVELQREMKSEIVRDGLRRLGRVDDPAVVGGPSLPTVGYRTTVRGLVVNERFAFRRAARHDGITVASCLTAHPMIDELIDVGRFGSAREVTLRAGVSTDERLALIGPSAGASILPDDVTVIGEDDLTKGRHAYIHEVVAGRRWRIGARSFFQPGPAAAGAIADVVADAAIGCVADGDVVVDLYGGGGLLIGTVLDRIAKGGITDVEGLLVERSRSSVADARHNLAEQPVTIVSRSVEDWRPVPASVVIADPAREGLSVPAVEAMVACAASRVVLVSCDAASAGRDVGALTSAGYVHRTSTVIDAFPQTHHVEVVTTLDLER